MKNLILIAALTLITSSVNAFEIATNLYTKHTFDTKFKDKDTGEQIKYNEDNNMYSVWFEVEEEEGDIPFEDGTALKWGVGTFKDSFYNTGIIVGTMLEARIKQYSIRGLGNFETYGGLGAIMTNSYEDMSFMPIIITHVGIRNKDYFANIGAYGLAAAITGNVGVRF